MSTDLYIRPRQYHSACLGLWYCRGLMYSSTDLYSYKSLRDYKWLPTCFLVRPIQYCTFGNSTQIEIFQLRFCRGTNFPRPKIRSGTRCAHQFWPQGARSAASAPARPAGWPAAGKAARARARIQRNSVRASSQISEFKSCMHESLLTALYTL